VEYNARMYRKVSVFTLILNEAKSLRMYETNLWLMTMMRPHKTLERVSMSIRKTSYLAVDAVNSA
jgi:hypothetical protein